MPYTIPEEDETLQAIIWRELMIPAIFPRTLFSDLPQIAEYALKLEGFTEFLEFEVQVPSVYMYYNCFKISLQKW
jgi:N-acetyl-beta-hexosaminidase